MSAAPSEADVKRCRQFLFNKGVDYGSLTNSQIVEQARLQGFFGSQEGATAMTRWVTCTYIQFSNGFRAVQVLLNLLKSPSCQQVGSVCPSFSFRWLPIVALCSRYQLASAYHRVRGSVPRAYIDDSLAPPTAVGRQIGDYLALHRKRKRPSNYYVSINFNRHSVAVHSKDVVQAVQRFKGKVRTRLCPRAIFLVAAQSVT